MPGMMFEGANGGKAGDLFELTTTDATTGATSYADITASIPNVDVTVNPYNGDSLDGPGPIIAADGADIYFQGFDSTGAVELFAYNQVTNHSTEVTAGAGWGSVGLEPTDLVTYDGAVYFNGWGGNGNHELWTGSVAGGASELSGSPLNPDFLTVYGNKLLFSGEDSKGRVDLYSYKSGGAVAKVAGTNGLDPTNIASASVGIRAEPVFGSTLEQLPRDVFMEGKGGALYEYNGSSISEVYAGSTAGGVQPQDIVGMEWNTSKYGFKSVFGEVVIPELEGAAFFSGVDSTGGRGLWMTEGTGTGATEVTAANFGATPAGLNPDDLTAINGSLYFTGNDNYSGGSDNGRGIFVYSPSTNTTKELVKSSAYNLEFNGESSQWGNLTPTDMTAYQGNLYFQASKGGGGEGLYEFHVATGQVSLVAPAHGQPAAGSAYSLTAF